jgi:hypothetical protein
MANAEGYLHNLPVCILYRLSFNLIGEEGEALIRKALQGKAGFELLF